MSSIKPGDVFTFLKQKVAVLEDPFYKTTVASQDVDLVLIHPLLRLARTSSRFYAAAIQKSKFEGGCLLLYPFSELCSDLENWQGSQLLEASFSSSTKAITFFFLQSMVHFPSDYFMQSMWRRVSTSANNVFSKTTGDLRLATLYTRFLSEAECVFDHRGRRLTVNDVSVEFRTVLELWQGSPLTDVQWSEKADTYFFFFEFTTVMLHRHYFYPRTDVPPEGYYTAMFLTIRNGQPVSTR